jgi:hypothetical protein
MGIAGWRNNFKTWKERRGIVLCSWRDALQYGREKKRVKRIAGNLRNPKVLNTLHRRLAVRHCKPPCRDFSDKQPIQTLNHQTQRNLS